MKRVRLRTKFLLIFSAVALAPLVLTLLLTYTRFQRSLEQDSSKLEGQLATTAAVKIKSFIISQVGILNTIATLYDQEFSTKNDASGKIIANILYRSDNFTDISIVNKEGKEIIRQNRILVFLPQDLRDLKETEAFKIVKERGLYIGPMYLKEGKPLFDLGRWITDSQGNFSGAVFAQVDAKILPEVMGQISNIAGPSGRVFMVNNKGIVIAHPDLSYILGEKDLSTLPTVANIVSGNPNIEISRKYINEKGEAVLGSAYPIILEFSDIRLPEVFPIQWFVIVEQQQSVVLAEAYQVVWFFLIISLIVLAMIVSTAFYFARRISAPVEALYRATVEFAKGNLKYRTQIKTNDEIGELAENFDHMAETVSNSIEHLKSMEKMKSEFVTIAAHQLRTPLTGMKWSLDYLSQEGDKVAHKEQQEMVKDLSSATDRMIGLVNDLLDVSQIEEGRFGITLERQSMLPLFENIKKTFERESRNKGVDLRIEVDPNLPEINMDSQKMEMALNNMISNAIKYSLGKGVVQLKAGVEKDQVLISIADSGMGIQKDEFDRIFSKFFRSKRALSYHTDGTGLGLYVSKNVIEGHGGKIWFESKENKGTIFFVSLPIYK